MIFYIKGLIRSMLYPLPKVGDIYIFDRKPTDDPWDEKTNFTVEVLETLHGWVRFRYPFLSPLHPSEDRLPVASFHAFYKLIQNQEANRD